MAYRKKTLRQFHYTARKLAKLIGKLQSIERSVKNLTDEVNFIEHEHQSLIRLLDSKNLSGHHATLEEQLKDKAI